MKVLHLVASFRLRGAEVFARDLYVALRSLGVDGWLVRLADGADQLGVAASLQAETLSAGTGFAKLRELRRMISVLRPDIVMAHGGQAMKFAVLASIGLDVPVVYRKIGLTEKWLGRWRKVKLPWLKWLLRRTAAVSAVGKAPRRELLGLFAIDERKIRTIYRGIPLERYRAGNEKAESLRHRFGLEDDSPILIAVGALAWEKNLEVMIRAMSKVAGEFQDAVLLLVGEGPEKDRLQMVTKELGVESRVRFLGVQKEMAGLFFLADVCLLTSLTEGVPGVLIEAGLAGTVCVCWDVAGAGEVVQDRVSGRVTPFGDETSFTAALLEVLRDADSADMLGSRARAFCRERFDIRRSAEEHLQLFNEVLSHHD